MGLTPEQARALGLRQLPDGSRVPRTSGDVPAVDAVAPPSVLDVVLRNKRNKRMTEVEERWLGTLRGEHPEAIIIPQFRVRCSKWDAPRPVHYTADFAVFAKFQTAVQDSYRCVLWEVKDRRRKPHSDELTRPKMATAHNPWIAVVYLAEWDGTKFHRRILA